MFAVILTPPKHSKLVILWLHRHCFWMTATVRRKPSKENRAAQALAAIMLLTRVKTAVTLPHPAAAVISSVNILNNFL